MHQFGSEYRNDGLGQRLPVVALARAMMVPTTVRMIIVWSRALAAGWGLAEAPGNHSDLAKRKKLRSWLLNFHILSNFPNPKPSGCSCSAAKA